MSKRRFLLLLVSVLVAALAVAVLVPEKAGRKASDERTLLLPEVGERINDTHSVSLLASGERGVALELEEGQWVIADLHDYPADWNRLRGLLADLAQAVVVERKTDNPAYYDRLGVEDPDREGAEGVLLTLRFEDEERALIVGKRASSRDGQYVRRTDAAASLLVDREFDLPLDPVDWAEREIVDVAAEDVREVEIIRPDGDWVLARKEAREDTDFVLENKPEDREIVSAWSVNSLGGALSALTMEGVEPLVSEPPEQAVRLRLLTFDGVEYLAQAWEAENGHWLSLRASRPEAVREEGSPAEAGGETGAGAAFDTEAFNSRMAPWRYRIPEYKYTALTKRLEDLLKAPEDEEATPE